MFCCINIGNQVIVIGDVTYDDRRSQEVSNQIEDYRQDHKTIP